MKDLNNLFKQFTSDQCGNCTTEVYNFESITIYYVAYDLVGFFNKALENYNKDNDEFYKYVHLPKVEETSVSYLSDFEIIFDASLSHEGGFRVETFQASIRIGLGVQKGFHGYAEVVEKVVKCFNRPWAVGNKSLF